MPRACSSGSRSVSLPVKARTSHVLPWSMWPAVPTVSGVAPRSAIARVGDGGGDFGAGVDCVARRRFVAEEGVARATERAAAEIVHERQLVTARDGGELLDPWLLA